MVTLQIEDTLADQLTVLAAAQGHSFQEIINEAIVRHLETMSHILKQDDDDDDASFEAMIGMAEADVTDLSVHSREYLRDYFKNEHGRID